MALNGFDHTSPAQELLEGENGINGEEQQKVPAGTANMIQTCANIFKAIVGAGSFALPFAFYNMGVVGGLLVIVISGIFCFSTVTMLIRCKNVVATKMPSDHVITYVDVARNISGRYMQYIVYFLSVTGSLGVSAAYLVFIGATLNTIYNGLAPVEYMLLIMVVLIPLCLLRTFKFLSYTSIIGDIGLAIGLSGTLAYGFQNMSMTSFGDHDMFRIETTPRSFGSVAFLFCVNFMILPIERAMRTPSSFSTALAVSMIVVTILNAGFGLIAFLLFSDSTCSNVVLNMSGSSYVYLVKIALCFDLSASYPLTMAPGREIIENTIVKSLAIYLQNRTSGYEAVGNIKYSNGEDAAQIRLERLKRNISNCVRIILVFVTLGVAQIKTFGEITNLVGGFSLSSLAFIVPPIMFVQQFSKELLKSTFGTMHFAYAVFILVFGFAAVGLTTYESIREFFEDVPEPANCLG